MIGSDYDGDILFVCRDPLSPAANAIFQAALDTNGISRHKIAVTNLVDVRPPGDNFHAHRRRDIEHGVANLYGLIDRITPNLVVGLGNEACSVLVPGWPGDHVMHAHGIEDRRGFVFEGIASQKVLVSIDPSAVQRNWIPWAELLRRDFAKAKREGQYAELRRPQWNTEIADTVARARQFGQQLLEAKRVAADIETDTTGSISCVGFSDASDRAFVFPGHYIDHARTVLERSSVVKIFANGAFDIFELQERAGIRVRGRCDDTQLAWHACFPQLGGKVEGESKVTRKGLSFLASILTDHAYWKDADAEDEAALYEYNGQDCVVTFEVMAQLDTIIDRLGVREAYQDSIDLVWPTVKARQRGMLVNGRERERRVVELNTRRAEIESELNEIVKPLLETYDGPVKHLFKEVWTCPCCRNGKKKREHCTECAGIVGSGKNGAIRKADLVAWLRRDEDPFEPSTVEGLSKAELIELVPRCILCQGEGQRVTLDFNPASNDQVAAVLYEMLKLPKRFNKGKLSVDQEKLKAMRGVLE